MPRINVELLQEGMRVVVDVKDHDNMLLIPAGSTLTAKHIDLLRSWEVAEVDAEATAENVGPEDVLAKLPEEVLAQLKAEVEQRFWEFEPDNPVYQAIFQRALLLKARSALRAARPAP
jgi:hypothetical protein